MEAKPTIEELDEKCAFCGEYDLIKFIDKEDPVWCPGCQGKGIPIEYHRKKGG